MIFVTVGTHSFDLLVETVDQAVRRKFVSERVIQQIGYGGEYVPRYCEYFRGAPSIEPFERLADLVVGHGGTGTTLELLLMGKPFISVSNPAMKDNHQHDFLIALESLGWVTYCRRVEDMPDLILSYQRMPKHVLPTSKLAKEMTGVIASLPEKNRASSYLGRIAYRLASRWEIDVRETLRPRDATLHLPEELLVDPRKTRK